MSDIKSGSEAAKEVGVALAVLYNHIRAGRVANLKAGGWPLGRGIEVDMDEVRAAVAGSRAKGATRAPRKTKADKALAHEIHDALDAEASGKRTRRTRSVDDTGEPTNTVRMHRYHREDQTVCPVDPSHGALIRMEKATKGKYLYCGHVAHDGRASHQLGGYAPQTANFFTPEEAATEQPIGRLGQIMLEWLYGGREDLAESLEAWMTANGIDVWIPERG